MHIALSRLLDNLNSATEPFHAEADEEATQLLGSVGRADYWRFLSRCYGFVFPVERAIVAVANVDQYVDLRRFRKHQLLRRDLDGFGMTPQQIEQLPQCVVPAFDSPEVALGWAYVIERSTLVHTNLFTHLATVLPGDVAFTSSYLKCYFGALGEMWRAFGLAVDRLAESPESTERLIEAAKNAFVTHRIWRNGRTERADRAPTSASLSGILQWADGRLSDA